MVSSSHGPDEKIEPDDQLEKLPRLSRVERLFEFVATLATGVVFITKVLKPLGLFIGMCAALWLLWAIFQLYRHGWKILKNWGLRVDQPNLRRSFIIPSVFALSLDKVNDKVNFSKL